MINLDVFIPKLLNAKISELADSSVNFAVRAWVKGSDYWDVFFNLNEEIYKTFDKEGLNIPYPQMDVHFHKTESYSLLNVIFKIVS